MLSEAENGFMKSRSRLDCIFTIGYNTENRLPTYIHIFHRFREGVWKGESDKLWAIMARKGIPHLFRAIQSLYMDNKILIEAGKPKTTLRVGLINCGSDKGVMTFSFQFIYWRCHVKLTDGSSREFYDWPICNWHFVVCGRSSYSVGLGKQVADGYTIVKLNLQRLWITIIYA